MQINRMDGALYKALLINGAENLKLNYREVDALNVFPVPDGDTGTNMRMTIEGGVNEIFTIDDTNLSEIAKKISRGMLMGARGNSGVILSQLFRGISKSFEDVPFADSIKLAEAFASGVRQAYKAVMKPVEGTILTVAREASERLSAISSSRMGIVEFFEEYIQEAKASLYRTPDLLPVLKEAGVVDSGGAGLIYILEGMLMALNGEYISQKALQEVPHVVGARVLAKKDSDPDFGYCTEFVLKIKEDIDVDSFSEENVLDKISPLGDSIVIVKDEDIIKVHIHTLKPGDVLNVGQMFGEFVHLKIENMTVQHNEITGEIVHQEEGPCECGEVHTPIIKRPDVRKKYAIVAVASGQGLVNAFKEMGADYVVSGGQSMNPSTEDFIRGFDTLNADNIIVFPNNKNIILAANQSAKIYTESKVWIIESKTLAQGFAALTMLDLNGSPKEIIDDLHSVIEKVTTGLVTYSIRDTELDGLKIRKDDFIGICDSRIVASNRRKYDTMKALLREAVTEDKEIITIIYGADTTEREVAEVLRHIERNYSNLEVDVIEGNQEVYSYILAIE